MPDFLYCSENLAEEEYGCGTQEEWGRVGMYGHTYIYILGCQIDIKLRKSLQVNWNRILDRAHIYIYL